MCRSARSKVSFGLNYKHVSLSCYMLSQIAKMMPSPSQSRLLTTFEKKAFENIGGKRENAGYQHFLFYPRSFLPFPKRENAGYQHFLFYPRSFLPFPNQIALKLEDFNLLTIGEELRLYCESSHEKHIHADLALHFSQRV